MKVFFTRSLQGIHLESLRQTTSYKSDLHSSKPSSPRFLVKLYSSLTSFLLCSGYIYHPFCFSKSYQKTTQLLKEKLIF